MAWEEPRTWDPGEVVSSAIINQHVADNLQDIFDRYTDVRGQYKDISTFTLSSSWAEVASVAVDTRHEAMLLIIVGDFPAGTDVSYRIDDQLQRTEFLTTDTTKTASEVWSEIIANLVTGLHTIAIDMRGSGTVNSLQIDLREIT